ncbi:hypothetical protein JK386_09690 [Nocardioides sp. zg-536]|uniref:Uncharacterized protein n=1 Tax=Nocardioides faecalis TaxID=2803858 RepID=A0A938Y6I9_9ACTN|nr:hypothetical protein [Nocardioides faecalis]MBM9460175.1 hypothetical protein [Nocardioides faecalis]MBS4754274.1 hypothetical protein [Nocardioides faecalis]QVI60030.1 hypothetical protein KG111_06915 [Nocardioides faecalis]
MTKHFEVDPDRVTELGAPVLAVAQQAIDAVSTAYAQDAAADVEARLVAELHSRGLRADEATLAETAHEIRSGHHTHPGMPAWKLTEE